ncbi:hypothetical protein D3C79_964530 [compost metagenome]
MLRHLRDPGYVQAHTLIHDRQTQAFTEVGNRAAQQRPALYFILFEHPAFELAPLARDQSAHIQMLNPLEQNLWIDPITK